MLTDPHQFIHPRIPYVPQPQTLLGPTPAYVPGLSGASTSAYFLPIEVQVNYLKLIG